MEKSGSGNVSWTPLLRTRRLSPDVGHSELSAAEPDRSDVPFEHWNPVSGQLPDGRLFDLYLVSVLKTVFRVAEVKVFIGRGD